MQTYRLNLKLIFIRHVSPVYFICQLNDRIDVTLFSKATMSAVYCWLMDTLFALITEWNLVHSFALGPNIALAQTNEQDSIR